MKKAYSVSAVLLLLTFWAMAQVDKDQLALAVHFADVANTEKLKEYVWRRKSDAFIDGALKLTHLPNSVLTGRESSRRK